MVQIFSEVRRVLRDDGVCWVNMGDCFAGSGGENANTGLQGGNTIAANSEDGTRSGLWRRNPRQEKLKQGNLMLMPHRLAIALQDAGWIVRNDLVWYKRNPMPESVAGWRFENEKLRKSSWRHTRAHEYIFQLVKKNKYWCNQEAVREGYQPSSIARKEYPVVKIGGNEATGKFGKGIRGNPDNATITPDKGGRNPRSVLDVPTAPYKGAHYATFPPNLIAPLIRASCPRRCCPECGMGWSPVVEKTQGKKQHSPAGNSEKIAHEAARGKHGATSLIYTGGGMQTNVLDYRPSCDCGHEDYVPGIVLDIFGGSGTTGMVAKQLMRQWIVMDISRPYLDEQAKIRTGEGSPANALDGLPLFEANDAT